MLSPIVRLLGLATCTLAVTHVVNVGQNGLQYTPNVTVAAVGDVISFQYYPKNHSVVQSSFGNPCMSTEGFYSGYNPSMAGPAAKAFNVVVNNTDPIYFYCSQPALGGHCAHGMVGCINCPSTALSAYSLAAMKTTNATVTHPAMIGGGIFSMINGTMPNATVSVSMIPPTATSSMVAYTGAADIMHVEGALLGGLGAAVAALVL